MELTGALLALLLLSSCCWRLQSRQLMMGERPTRRVSGENVLNWEPRMDNCPDFDASDILSVKGLRFRKINRTMVALFGIIDLKKTAAAPLEMQLTIEKLHMGTYAFHLTIASEDVCKEISNKDTLWGRISSQLEIYECPLTKREIVMNNFKVPLDSLTLGPHTLGRYRSKLVLSATVEGEKRTSFCQTFYLRVEQV